MLLGLTTLKLANPLATNKFYMPNNFNRPLSTTNPPNLAKKNSVLDWFLMSPRKLKNEEKGIIAKPSESQPIKLKEPYKLYKLCEGPNPSVNITKSEAKLYYTQLQTIRNIEEASDSFYKENIARGMYHLYAGQEACAVGMRAAMRANDSVITARRCHGWSYLMGATPFGILAELAGRQSGFARGKGGSVHMYAPGFYGSNGIVGAQVPIGAGLALASKLKKNGGVCLAVYGDGSADKGQIFESYNMASLWKLPCLFVCENNISSPCTTYFYRRGGDRMPGIWVDGTDVLAVKEATKFAIDFCVDHGPLMMELNTSSNGGSEAMRNLLRRQRDPLSLFRRTCLENKLIDIREIREIDQKARLDVEFAKRKAKNDPEAPISELVTDVYADCPEKKIRNVVGSYVDHMHTERLENKKVFVGKLKTAKAREIWEKNHAEPKNHEVDARKLKLIK